MEIMYNFSGGFGEVSMGDSISGLTPGTASVRVVAENDQGRGWQNGMNSATVAIPLCQQWIEDCTR